MFNITGNAQIQCCNNKHNNVLIEEYWSPLNKVFDQKVGQRIVTRRVGVAWNDERKGAHSER